MKHYTDYYYYHEGECLMELLEYGYHYDCCKFAKGQCRDFSDRPKDEYIKKIAEI